MDGWVAQWVLFVLSLGVASSNLGEVKNKLSGYKLDSFTIDRWDSIIITKQTLITSLNSSPLILNLISLYKLTTLPNDESLSYINKSAIRKYL